MCWPMMSVGVRTWKSSSSYTCGVRFVCWNVIQSFVLARKNNGSGARVPASVGATSSHSARMREVPARFVQLEVKLDRGSLVLARAAKSVTGVIAAWISIRCSGLRWQTVQRVVRGGAVRTEARDLLLRVEIH